MYIIINFLLTFLGGNESPKWSGLNSDLGSSSPQPQGLPGRVSGQDYMLKYFQTIKSIKLGSNFNPMY